MRILVLIISICLIVIACGKQETAVNLRLTPAERSRIDTLYTMRLDSLRPIWDSLCEAHYTEMVAVALDSIVQQRLEEEERLRSRFSE